MTGNDWEPMVTLTQARKDFLQSPATSTPIAMRRRGSDHKWIYREPTEQEIREYIEAEA